MNVDSNGVITLCIFMVVHLCGTVWWMSKVNATLGFIGNQVSGIMSTIASHEATYAKKEDVAEKLANRDAQIAAIWKKIDARLDAPHVCPNGKHHESA